jgi:hypothetical protein
MDIEQPFLHMLAARSTIRPVDYVLRPQEQLAGLLRSERSSPYSFQAGCGHAHPQCLRWMHQVRTITSMDRLSPGHTPKIEELVFRPAENTPYQKLHWRRRRHPQMLQSRDLQMEMIWPGLDVS